MAREIVGPNDFYEVHVKASFETCENRDVKGLYAKANAGEVRDFTGRQSRFEEPQAPWPVLDTEKCSPAESLEQLWSGAQPLVQASS